MKSVQNACTAQLYWTLFFIAFATSTGKFSVWWTNVKIQTKTKFAKHTSCLRHLCGTSRTSNWIAFEPNLRNVNRTKCQNTVSNRLAHMTMNTQRTQYMHNAHIHKRFYWVVDVIHCRSIRGGIRYVSFVILVFIRIAISQNRTIRKSIGCYRKQFKSTHQ